jgi:dTDP-4-dehydrorhamnose reductase
MRALVLGAGGMLGSRLWRELRGRFETYAALRRPYADYASLDFFDERRTIDRVDAARDDDLDRVFAVARPRVVINAIGIVKQRREADDAVNTIVVNSLLPHRLAERCASTGARLIQLSTDCVFSGARGEYSEADVPDACDLYGRSKLLGEVAGPNCFTIRTSMVGREIGSSRGLIEWFLSHRGESVPGFTRARFSGLSTLELSRLIADVIEHHGRLEGVWHVAGNPISKFDLLSMVNEVFGLGTQLRPDDSFVCDRTLDACRFNSATGYRPPSWATMVAELAADPTPYDAWANTWTSNERDRSTASIS